LIKYAEVLKALKIVEDALEVRGSGSGDEAVEVKEEEEGLWAKRRREVEKEVRRRVPEFQVVLGFSQPKTGSSVVKGTTSTTPDASAPSTAKTGKTPTNPVRNALLQESAQRLLLLYHMYLPEVVAEARFDVGKALTNFDGAAAVGDEENEAVEDVPESAQRLQVVQRLHVLRTLKESDQFIWTNKTCTPFSPTSHSTTLTSNCNYTSFRTNMSIRPPQILHIVNRQSSDQINPPRTPLSSSLLLYSF
jgi:nucleolar pre-ribosomal-associated protein 1